jgi:hypothetical protein
MRRLAFLKVTYLELIIAQLFKNRAIIQLTEVAATIS